MALLWSTQTPWSGKISLPIDPKPKKQRGGNVLKGSMRDQLRQVLGQCRQEEFRPLYWSMAVQWLDGMNCPQIAALHGMKDEAVRRKIRGVFYRAFRKREAVCA